MMVAPGSLAARFMPLSYSAIRQVGSYLLVHVFIHCLRGISQRQQAQELVERDWKVAHAHATGVVDPARQGRADSADSKFDAVFGNQLILTCCFDERDPAIA
jgi:hypothetical protein